MLKKPVSCHGIARFIKYSAHPPAEVQQSRNINYCVKNRPTVPTLYLKLSENRVRHAAMEPSKQSFLCWHFNLKGRRFDSHHRTSQASNLTKNGHFIATSRKLKLIEIGGDRRTRWRNMGVEAGKKQIHIWPTPSCRNPFRWRQVKSATVICRSPEAKSYRRRLQQNHK